MAGAWASKFRGSLCCREWKSGKIKGDGAIGGGAISLRVGEVTVDFCMHLKLKGW